MVARFKSDRHEAYREFIDKCEDFKTEIAKQTAARHFNHNELEENDVEMKKLQGWLEMIKKLDFHEGRLAAEAAEWLKGCESPLELMGNASSMRTTGTAERRKDM